MEKQTSLGTSAKTGLYHVISFDEDETMMLIRLRWWCWWWGSVWRLEIRRITAIVYYPPRGGFWSFLNIKTPPKHPCSITAIVYYHLKLPSSGWSIFVPARRYHSGEARQERKELLGALPRRLMLRLVWGGRWSCSCFSLFFSERTMWQSWKLWRLEAFFWWYGCRWIDVGLLVDPWCSCKLLQK